MKTKTSSLKCCINLEIDCQNTPLTFISQCKLGSVLPAILIKFYVIRYVVVDGVEWCCEVEETEGGYNPSSAASGNSSNTLVTAEYATEHCHHRWCTSQWICKWV